MQRLIYPGIRTIQRQRSVLTTEFSVSGATGGYVDFGLNVQVTPKFNTSKIIISGTIDGILYQTSQMYFRFRLLRNLAVVKEFGYPTALSIGSTVGGSSPVVIQAEDVPGVAGEILAYKAQVELINILNLVGVGRINAYGLASSEIIVEEVI